MLALCSAACKALRFALTALSRGLRALTPPPRSFLAAVSDSEKGPWTLVPLTVSEDVTAPRTVSITVPASPAAPPVHIIAAVLVYVDRVPDGLPQTSAQLADFGADLMYVSSRLKIVVPQ